MPLTLQSFNFAIICDENELETYDVKQQGPNSTTAFIASEAGKQFNIAISNLSDYDLLVALHIDGEFIKNNYLRIGEQGAIRGFRTSATTILPFKFQELELVDPDLEHAATGPEMGTIELRAFRCRYLGYRPLQPFLNPNLHQGRVSERSKKAGWHHVSTADEAPTTPITSRVECEKIDPPSAPCASVKVFYRPRELLMADGVIIGRGVGEGGSEVNNRKRVRERGSPGPSKRHTGSTVKKEELSADARVQRIQALEAELNSLKMAGGSGSSVKHELRTPSPIVVGEAAGEVIDLTLED